MHLELCDPRRIQERSLSEERIIAKNGAAVIKSNQPLTISIFTRPHGAYLVASFLKPDKKP